VVGLDTNVLVRFFTRDDLSQATRARRAIEKASQEQVSCCISTIVLCELVWVLRTSLGFRKEQILDTIESVFDAPEFVVEDRDIVREAIALYRTGAGDLSDYLIGLRNRRDGCRETLTFDEALAGSDLFTLP
jgi:predicted nucleic-acid-binding protein